MGLSSFDRKKRVVVSRLFVTEISPYTLTSRLLSLISEKFQTENGLENQVKMKNFLGRSPLHFRLISESENRWKYLATPVGDEWKQGRASLFAWVLVCLGRLVSPGGQRTVWGKSEECMGYYWLISTTFVGEPSPYK